MLTEYHADLRAINTFRMDSKYVCAIAKVRHAELKLFDDQMMEMLLGAKTEEEAVRMIVDRGWGDGETTDIDRILEMERNKIWDFIAEFPIDLSILDIFRVRIDFSNIKAAIKEAALVESYPKVYFGEKYGTFPVDMIRQAISSNNYKILPDYMYEAAVRGHEAFLTTGDGELCDLIVDRELLEVIRSIGEQSKNEFFYKYSQIKVASTDIAVAARAALRGKSREYLKMALCDCDIISVNGLIDAAMNGIDSIISFLGNTDFAEFAQQLRQSPACFVRWADNYIVDMMKSQQYDEQGAGPVAAYVIARENEIKSVRIIVAGIRNNLPMDIIRGRVRASYV